LGDLVTANWLDDSDQVADLLRPGSLRRAAAETLAWSGHSGVPVYATLWRALRLKLGFPWPEYARISSPANQSCGWDDSLQPWVSDLSRSLRREQTRRAVWKRASAGRRKLFRAISAVLEDRVLRAPEPLQHVLYTHPFSHRPLVEFMLAAPASILCRAGEPRRLMRRASKDLLPPIVLDRRSKATFNRVFADALRPLAAELLRNPHQIRLANYGYVDAPNLQERLQCFLSGLECNQPQLRNILLLEFWLRHREEPRSAVQERLVSLPKVTTCKQTLS